MKIYPHSIEPARCKLCLEPIAWALTFPNRKKVPLDRPIKTTYLVFDADGHEIAVVTSGTHFDTCTKYERVKAKPIEQARLF